MRDSQRLKLIRSGLGKIEKTENRRNFKCMFPKCKEDSIRSHSQQKKSQLSAIEKDSFVFGMNKNLYSIFKSNMSEHLEKITIGEASRYRGYCSYHDSKIFLPIENGNLDIDYPEHNFLLLLRATSYEYANKRSAYFKTKNVISKLGHLYSSSEGLLSTEVSHEGVKLFLEKDAPYYFEKLFKIYKSKDWSGIKFKSFDIGRNIGVSSTTCFSPLRKIHNEWTTDNIILPQPYLSFSVIPDVNRTSISFSWLSDFDDLCSEYKVIDPVQKNIMKILNMYIFCESEDVCVNPELWGKLSLTQREEIYTHMRSSDSLSQAYSIPMVLE